MRSSLRHNGPPASPITSNSISMTIYNKHPIVAILVFEIINSYMSEAMNDYYTPLNTPLDAHLVYHDDKAELNVRTPASSRQGSITSLSSSMCDTEAKDCSCSGCVSPLVQCESYTDTTSLSRTNSNINSNMNSNMNSMNSMSSTVRGCRKHHHRRPSMALKFDKPIVYK